MDSCTCNRGTELRPRSESSADRCCIQCGAVRETNVPIYTAWYVRMDGPYTTVRRASTRHEDVYKEWVEDQPHEYFPTFTAARQEALAYTRAIREEYAEATRLLRELRKGDVETTDI